jgi:uncharacterized protein (TIGR03437 family)
MRGIRVCFGLLIFVPVILAEQTVARYFDLPPDAQSEVLAVDAQGDFFVAATFVSPSGQYRARVLKTGQDGRTLAGMELDLLRSAAAAVTPDGHLVLAGTPSSEDFPLVSPVVPNAGPHSDVIVELNADLTAIVFSTRLGGTTGYGPGHGGTSIYGVAVDAAGNLYATGTTADTDFPVTPGAFQTAAPTGDPFGTAAFAFLSEISADRTRLVYSTYFGDSAVTCNGGSHCIGKHGVTSGVGVDIGSSGDITIAGSTTANHLPVTPGAYASQCLCTSDAAAGFAARFAGSGSLRWATYLPLGTGNPISLARVSDVALDTAGNVILAGSAGPGFATSPGALQPEIPDSGSLAGFVAKLDSSGQRLLLGTFLGGSQDLTPETHRIAVDSQGAIWVTGTSDPGQLPRSTGPNLGSTYIGSLSADGSAANALFTAPSGAAGQALVMTPSGASAILGQANSVLVTTGAAGPSLMGVANSAEAQVSNVVAPFELVSLYGIGLGPTTPLGAEVVGGIVTAELGGVQVLFDGTPAPLLYAGPNQLNAVVPQEIHGHDTTTMQINTPAGVLQGPTMTVRLAQPAVFVVPGSNGMAAALNQDGTLNSASNPAAPGSIVSVWGTGAGYSGYAKTNGEIVNGTPGPVALPVSVIAGDLSNAGRSLEVLYAGDAPGLVAGVIQVNFRLPETTSTSGTSLKLQVGEAVSPPFSVYIH